MWNDLSPRQQHIQKLVQMEAEYKTASGFRKKDLRKGIQRMNRELLAYNRNFGTTNHPRIQKSKNRLSASMHRLFECR